MNAPEWDTAISPRRLGALVVWMASAILTAHGMFSVASDCGVPELLAALYPVAVDGLALVAYRTAAERNDASRWYAGAVVLICAGSSGIAQAVYLARTTDQPWQLAAGVGAAPAVLAVLAAHLDWLAAGRPGRAQPASGGDWSPPADAADAGRGDAGTGAPLSPPGPDGSRLHSPSALDGERTRLHLVPAGAVECIPPSALEGECTSDANAVGECTPSTSALALPSALHSPDADALGEDDALVAQLRAARERDGKPYTALRPVAKLLGVGQKRARRIIDLADRGCRTESR